MNLSKAIRRRLVMFGAAAAATLAIAVPAIAGQYLSASAFTMPTNPTAPKNGVYYASDYKSVEEMQKAARETVRQMGQESTVLLKKSDKGLLTQGMNVTIFGKNSVNPIYLGTGSGSATFYDGVANETVDLYQALEADGVHVNPAMKAFYETNALSGNGRPTGGQGSGMPQWNERSFGWPVGETSPEKFANAPDESYNVYGDAAVIMFSRIGGEGYDLPRSSWDYNRGANGANIRTEAGESVPVVNGIPKAVEGRSVYSDPACTTKATASSEAFYTESYLQLDDYERALLKSVKDSGKFDKIIVLINSANAMDLTDLDDPQGLAQFMGDPAVYDTCKYPGEVVVACTWNKELAYEMGKMVGNEGLIGNEKGTGTPYTGWYAPAVNIHRSQFAGRNWEYYSEDGLFSGLLGAEVVKGAMEKGMFTCPKHFALNDQETYRDANGVLTWANEQTMREIYFKPFERIVKDGGTTGMMSSFNRIGKTWTGGYYELLTELLRDEWGFEGFVITDYGGPKYMPADQMLRAGGDLYLGQGLSWLSNDAASATNVSVIRNAVHNILYTTANSNMLNGISSTTDIRYIKPVWDILLYVADGVLLAAGVVWITLTSVRAVKKARAQEEK